MRASGVRSLLATCFQCHHEMIIDADHWLDHVPLSSFGPKIACAKCRTLGADVRPNWPEGGCSVARAARASPVAADAGMVPKLT
jgi:hypothetical protein